MLGVQETLAYVAFAISGVVAVALVRYFDLWERESYPTLLLSAALAFFVMASMTYFEPALAEMLAPHTGTLTVPLVAALCEEAARLVLLMLLAFVLLPRCFNDPLDGLIYGAVVGVGMAIEEGLGCWGQSQRGKPIAWLSAAQAVGGVCGHLVFGAIVGYAIGLRASSKAHERQIWLRWLFVNLLVAMSLHFTWNWLRDWKADTLAELLVAGLVRWFAVLLGIAYFVCLASVGYWRSQGEFAPGTTRHPLIDKLNHIITDFWNAITFRPPIVHWRTDPPPSGNVDQGAKHPPFSRRG